MEDIAAKYADIAARYTAARKVLAEAKKTSGKKSPEAKAARKAARAIKKERVAFVAANPGFTPPPARRGGSKRGLSAATRGTPAEDLLKLYFELNEVRGFSINEVEKLLKNGQVDDAMAGRITPGGTRHPGRAPAVPLAEAVNTALAIAERVQADSAPVVVEPAVVVAGEPIPPAPVAPAAVGAPAGSLSGAILHILRMAAEPLSPAQVATLVKTAGEGSITAKQAADAMGRLAKQGKLTKDGSAYSVKA